MVRGSDPCQRYGEEQEGVRQDQHDDAFCTTVFNGKDGLPRESCHKCHAGYGWTRSKFDLTDKSRVDCLVCHAQKGNYTRAGVGAEVDTALMAKGTMNLDLAAKSVGKPGLKNCGVCHFYGGGADAVKSPGLDSTLEAAPREQDVHMAKKAARWCWSGLSRLPQV